MRVLNRTLLEDSGRFQVVGEAQDGRQAIELAGRLQPELVLLDLAMPVLGGMEALPKIRVVAPSACIIVLSMLQRQESERQVLALGAQAFVDKGMESDAFVNRIVGIMAAWRPPA